MNFKQFKQILDSISHPKYFLSVNFGCRVNAAETNLLSQILINNGFKPSPEKPKIIIINTCSITKKGEIESLSRARILNRKYPDSIIFVTGCANLKKISSLKNVYVFNNKIKEKILKETSCLYTPNIKDKFSHTYRYILKVQSGCNQFCSYCTVPFQRQYLWSLLINDAVNTTNQAIKEGYKEIIITGVNLNLYEPGLSNLIEALLTQTSIPLISFGSIPLNCIDDKFIKLLSAFNSRLSSFLHIPIQSGSDKILKLMNRPYAQKDILDKFNQLNKISPLHQGEMSTGQRGFEFGTDIIVGFPGETQNDFQETLDLCKKIGFQKIHTFRFSARPKTLAKIYFQKYPKIEKKEIHFRSSQIRNLNK